jgi:hypothetical protein
MPIVNAPPESSSRWWMITLGMCVILLACFYFWPASKVTLDDGGYQTTLALYRICNQQDAEALAKLDESLNDPSSPLRLSDESRTVIASIRALAESGRWDEAEIACRQAMDEQVKR